MILFIFSNKSPSNSSVLLTLSTTHREEPQGQELRLERKKEMKVVALVSGGKDSCYVMMKCIQYGHEVPLLLLLLSYLLFLESFTEISSKVFFWCYMNLKSHLGFTSLVLPTDRGIGELVTG